MKDVLSYWETSVSGTKEMEEEARKVGVGDVDPHIRYPADGQEGHLTLETPSYNKYIPWLWREACATKAVNLQPAGRRGWGLNSGACCLELGDYFLEELL